MNPPSPSGAPPPPPLPPIKLDFAGPGLCAQCKREIADYYYLHDTERVCVLCHADLAKKYSRRTTYSDYSVAFLLGTLAALAGAALMYALLIFADSEILILSVGIGAAVGAAVRLGAGNGGGKPFQAMAVALAYFGLVAAYVPIMDSAIAEDEASLEERLNESIQESLRRSAEDEDEASQEGEQGGEIEDPDEARSENETRAADAATSGSESGDGAPFVTIERPTFKSDPGGRAMQLARLIPGAAIMPFILLKQDPGDGVYRILYYAAALVIAGAIPSRRYKPLTGPFDVNERKTSGAPPAA